LREIFAFFRELVAGEGILKHSTKDAGLEAHAALVLRALGGVEIYFVQDDLRREAQALDEEIALRITRLGREIFPQRHARNLQPSDTYVSRRFGVEEKVKTLHRRHIVLRADGDVEVLDPDAIRVSRGLA